MTYTALPSIKGQITIPTAIREKYGIGKETPMIIEDKGRGMILIKIMRLVDHDDPIGVYENEKEHGITFKNGITPEAILKAIKKIDG